MKRTPIILISLFIAMVIVIPALIVLPFSGQHNTVPAKVSQAKENQTKVKTSHDPAIPVSVMRHTTQEVDQVELRDYLVGVVASEMPADFHLEALKAQALAARTYIARFMINSGAGSVSDTTSDQVYKNKDELKQAWGPDYDAKITKIEEAVDETAGEVITYDGKLISPSFFSTSNGFTENSEDYWENSYPYLRSVKSPWDLSSPKYKYIKTLPVKTVEQELGVELPANDGTVGIIQSLTQGKRVAKFKVDGKVFTGREVRDKLALRSADFRMERAGDKVQITTYGYGHGVGMSQYGANGMAAEGKTYKDIITHFYTGVAISKLSNFQDQLLAKK